MQILETERLILREIVEDDAEFVLDLLNQRQSEKQGQNFTDVIASGA